MAANEWFLEKTTAEVDRFCVSVSVNSDDRS